MNYSQNVFNQFTGRRFKLDLLKRRVQGLKEGCRQNVALLGDQYAGKSSILQKFVHDLDDERLVPIYLDLEKKDAHYIYYKFMTSLLYHYAKNKNLKLSTDLKVLSNVTYKYIPETVRSIETIRAMFESNRLAQAFRALISLIDIFVEESGMLCVLVFDEFQVLEELDVPDIFKDIGNKIMTQKKCLYIFASSYEEKAQKILNEKLDLLFGQFEIINVDFFSSSTAVEHIEHLTQHVSMGVQLKNFLADFTGGHPLHLNLILNEVNALCGIHQQKDVYLPLLIQAIENVIFNQWGVLSRHFDLTIGQLCIGKGSKITSALLISIANGCHKIPDLVEKLDVTPAQVKKRLNDLLDQNVIAKNSGYFYFKDKLLRYWIRHVYQSRIRSVELDYRRPQKKFKEDLTAAIVEFQVMSRRKLPERVADLIQSFNNETFDINGRKYRLPAFERVAVNKPGVDIAQTFDVIQARNEKSSWFVLLKREKISEKDVSDLVLYRKTLVPHQKCVIVALADVDEGVRLRLMQEKMWLWHEKELNKLMNLYDKPYVI